MPNNPNQKTTGFTNVQDIVRSNRQNRLGKTVQSGVQNVIGQGQQQLQGAQQQFQQGAQQNQIGTAADQAYVNQTIQNPTNVQQTDVDRFANLRSGQYKGPTQLGNREELGARGQELQGIAGSASNEQGRRGLLQRFVAPQQQYTQGQQRLDNLLLGQTGGQATRNARQGANQFNQQLLSADQAAQAQGQGYTQQAQQFGNQVNNQLGQAQTDQQKDIEQRMVDSQKQSEAARKALQMLLTKPQTQQAPTDGSVSTMPVFQGTGSGLSQEEYDSAKKAFESSGLGGEQFFNPAFFTTKPEEIIGQGAINPTKESVATEADKSRSLALAKLFGRAPELFNEQSQVGGYDPLSFLDKDRYNKAIGSSKKTFDEYDAFTNAKTAAQSAKEKADRDRELISHYIAENPNSRVTKHTGNPYYQGSDFSSGLNEGEEFFSPSTVSQYGNIEGNVLSKQFADQLRQNYGGFSNDVNQANAALKSQNLGSVANSNDNFNNYLRSLMHDNAPFVDYGGGDRTATNDIDYSVQKAIDDAQAGIQDREKLGAGSSRQTLLERLQGLMNK